MPISVIFYSLVYYCFIPLLLLRFIWRSRRNSGYRARLNERFGFYSTAKTKGVIHFHLVSVGETLAALPVVQHFLETDPRAEIVITSTTPTGSAEVQKRLGRRVINVYLPFDLPDCMARFYRHFQPKLTVLMETEMWPNMLYAAKQRSAHVVLMNARMSERSAQGYHYLKPITRFMMSAIDRIACQDESSQYRFIYLGAQIKHVENTGNLKYDVLVAQNLFDLAANLRQEVGSHRKVWIAGSTHKGEDEILLDAHKQVLHSFPDAILMIVPRHPERFTQVAELVSLKSFRSLRKSQLESAGNTGVNIGDAQVLVCDSLGELQMLYGVADVCFVAGSLVDTGGHNPIEPILMNKPVISGPTVFNFQAVYNNLMQCDGVLIKDSAETISEGVIDLFSHPDKWHAQVEAAKEEIAKHQGAKSRTLEILNQYL